MSVNIISLSREELAAQIEAMGEKPFRAKQIWQWVYDRGVTSFDLMTNISKDLREKFAEHFYIGRPEIVRDELSEDGTRKWLMKFEDGGTAETVYIPEMERGTLCISSQIGCTLTCKFCHTGTQKLVRNLTSEEILYQLLVARDILGEWPSTQEDRRVSNVVMMGMGEPLYNYENVKKALLVMMDNEGISISRRKITLSTSGVVPHINQCGKDLGVNLAISLHATNDELRSKIMPLNKKYNLAELLEACKAYPESSNSKRITFEYVMLKDINDSDKDAKALIKLLRDVPSKINLIPFNPWPGSFFECSSWERIQRFAKILNDAGYICPVRKPRGRDIYAACGQLKSDTERQAKHKNPKS
jgi:23S rRNA (adenine2503-C2)-methyltransferase